MTEKKTPSRTIDSLNKSSDGEIRDVLQMIRSIFILRIYKMERIFDDWNGKGNHTDEDFLFFRKLLKLIICSCIILLIQAGKLDLS